MRRVANVLYICLKIDGEIDTVALEEAVSSISGRHSAFRTVIMRNSAISDARWESAFAAFSRTGIVPRGLFVQRSTASVETAIHRHDHRGIERESQLDAIRPIVEREAARFLGEEIPHRIGMNLIQEDDSRHLLILAIDHRISDGWSAKLIAHEIEQLYRRFVDGLAPPAAPGMGYPEFTAWQNEALQTSYFDEDLAYWEQHWREFGGARISHVDLPFAHGGPIPAVSGNFKTERLVIDNVDLVRIRAKARQLRVTLYMWSQAALASVLRHYTKKEKLALWCHCQNRILPQTWSTVGYFINTHINGLVVPENVTFQDLLTQVRSRQTATLKHQQMPLPHLWRTLQCGPRFTDSGIMLDYGQLDRGNQIQHVRDEKEVTFRPITLEQTLPRMANIGINITDRGHELLLRADYLSTLYASEGVKEMLKDFVEMATAASTKVDLNISTLKTVTRRYAHHPPSHGTEMSEFVLLDSQGLPRREASPEASGSAVCVDQTS